MRFVGDGHGLLRICVDRRERYTSRNHSAISLLLGKHEFGLRMLKSSFSIQQMAAMQYNGRTNRQAPVSSSGSNPNSQLVAIGEQVDQHGCLQTPQNFLVTL
jgi:hypothetical protein